MLPPLPDLTTRTDKDLADLSKAVQADLHILRDDSYKEVLNNIAEKVDYEVRRRQHGTFFIPENLPEKSIDNYAWYEDLIKSMTRSLR
jgi:hypothetical protein